MGKPTMWFPNWSYTNQAAKTQKMARGWKFCIYKVEELYYPCSENKGTDQLRKADLRLWFRIDADCWFSKEAAHFMIGQTE